VRSRQIIRTGKAAANAEERRNGVEEKYTMQVSLQIYGPGNQNLRIVEETTLSRTLTLTEAAQVLTRFSDLAKTIQQEQTK